jgi:hypothetical protein
MVTRQAYSVGAGILFRRLSGMPGPREYKRLFETRIHSGELCRRAMVMTLDDDEETSWRRDRRVAEETNR